MFRVKKNTYYYGKTDPLRLVLQLYWDTAIQTTHVGTHDDTAAQAPGKIVRTRTTWQNNTCAINQHNTQQICIMHKKLP